MSCEDAYRLKNEDYDRFLNTVALNRKPSLSMIIPDLYKAATADTIKLAGGHPNPNFFPIEDATVNLKDGTSIYLNAQLMEEAQQYGSARGYPPFVEKMTEFVVKFHNPPCMENRMVAITAGGQDGFARALEMMISFGDYVIVENPTYFGALSVVSPYKVKVIGIEGDQYGMIPERLEEALSHWEAVKVRNKKEGVPKVMYINPSAANPTGVSITTDRKKTIYEIARKFNLIILEDDPYYFLQFDTANSYPASFLSLDTDCRVLRFDSFSKIISSGFRTGFVTGPKELIVKLLEHAEATICHPSNLPQIIIYEILKMWEDKGFEEHIGKIRQFYLRQQQTIISAAEKHLRGLCHWSTPTGGMFLWLKVLGLQDTTQMVLQKALEKKQLIVMPGKGFMTNESEPCPYIRISYSLASPEEIDEGFRRLAELIKEDLRNV